MSNYEDKKKEIIVSIECAIKLCGHYADIGEELDKFEQLIRTEAIKSCMSEIESIINELLEPTGTESEYNKGYDAGLNRLVEKIDAVKSTLTAKIGKDITNDNKEEDV